MICPYCHTHMQDGSMFCNTCGKVILPEDTKEKYEPAPDITEDIFRINNGELNDAPIPPMYFDPSEDATSIHPSLMDDDMTGTITFAPITKEMILSEQAKLSQSPPPVIPVVGPPPVIPKTYRAPNSAIVLSLLALGCLTAFIVLQWTNAPLFYNFAVLLFGLFFFSGMLLSKQSMFYPIVSVSLLMLTEVFSSTGLINMVLGDKDVFSTGWNSGALFDTLSSTVLFPALLLLSIVFIFLYGATKSALCKNVTVYLLSGVAVYYLFSAANLAEPPWDSLWKTLYPLSAFLYITACVVFLQSKSCPSRRK